MNNDLQLLVFTYYWPPSGGAGVQRNLKFAKYLPQFGIEPHILTVEEYAASYPVIDTSLTHEIADNLLVTRTKSWDPFRAYSKLRKTKTIPSSGFANETKPGFIDLMMRFIRGNIFLPDARRGWNKYAILAASQLIEQQKINCILTSSPPHSTQLIGLYLKKKYELPWIADLRDPWTDIYYYNQLFPTWLAKKIDAHYERKVLENADKIIVVSESIKTLFLKKSNKLSPEKIRVIPNGYDPEDFAIQTESCNEKFTISYTGTIAATYDLETFAKACAHVFMNGTKLFKLQFIGSTKSVISPILEEHGLLEFTQIIPAVEHRKSIEYLQKSDALLLLIPQTKENKGILTGKLFEYLGAKKVIIGIGPSNGDAAKIIDETRSGKMIDYGEVDVLAAYLEDRYQNWLEKPNSVGNSSVELYSRIVQTEQLSLEIKNLIAS
ncbi:MAG: glycosyltransferase family 4 protein [Bacteroidales bacterium]|nr:glycosyltransferase family 4 protein [Bacteroidales bacterium]